MKTLTNLIFAAILLVPTLSKAQNFISTGNSVEALRNGHDLNSKRLDIIQNAKKFIYLKTFIINRDASEAPVFKALCARAQEGIDVRMIIDDIGRRQGGNPIKVKNDDFSIEWFRSCGIRLERYAKPTWGVLEFVLYNQHDKFIINETTGIMGGTNYSRDYSAHAQLSEKWYDFDIAVEGPAVCSLQKIFNLSWNTAYKKRLSFMKKKKQEEAFALGTLHQNCTASPLDSNIDVKFIYNDPLFSKERPFVDYFISSIDQVIKSKENRTIDLYAPYLVPNKKVVTKLIEASKAGVRIRLITNSATSIDPEAFHAYVAMLMKVKKLVLHGVEIHLWKPSQFEARLLAKDNVFHKKGGCFGKFNCFVGSHNLDVRGDNYSSELIAVLSDTRFTEERQNDYENDMRYTIPMNEELRKKLLKESKLTDKILAKIAAWAM